MPHAPFTIDDGHLGSLAIFPLETVVLLPHAILPLHIFEPRYRVMTAHALERGTPIAIARVVPGQLDGHGRPVVEPVVGVGRVIQQELQPDGRYNLLLAGVERATIEQELDVDTPYRQVRARRLESTVHEPVVVEHQHRILRELIFRLRASKPAISSVMLRLLDESTSRAAAVDRVCSALTMPVERRYELLAQPVVDERYDVVVELVAEAVANAEAPVDDEGGPLLN